MNMCNDRFCRMAAIDGCVSPTYGNVALNNEGVYESFIRQHNHHVCGFTGVSTTAFSPTHGNQGTHGCDQPPDYHLQATSTKYPSVAYHPHNSEQKQVVITTQVHRYNSDV